MENKTIEITVQLNEDDYWRVGFAGRIKRFLLVTLIYLPVALLIMYFVVFGAGGDSFAGNNLSVFIVFFIICMIPFVFLPFARYSLKKLAKKLAKVSEKTTIIFSESEIQTNSSSRSSKIAWGDYEKIQETNEDFVCFLNNHTLYPIPKRFFDDNVQILEFRELVRKKLCHKARLKTPKQTLGLK